MTEQYIQRIIEASLTSATCGEGCWYARETICHCSCGGKNHGCLLKEGAERPARTSKIHGVMYELSAVGRYVELAREASTRLKALEPHAVVHGYKYFWTPTEPGSPVYLKCATKAQLGAWKELNGMPRGTYLLWKAVTK